MEPSESLIEYQPSDEQREKWRAEFERCLECAQIKNWGQENDLTDKEFRHAVALMEFIGYIRHEGEDSVLEITPAESFKITKFVRLKHEKTTSSSPPTSRAVTRRPRLRQGRSLRRTVRNCHTVASRGDPSRQSERPRPRLTRSAR